MIEASYRYNTQDYLSAYSTSDGVLCITNTTDEIDVHCFYFGYAETNNYLFKEILMLVKDIHIILGCESVSAVIVDGDLRISTTLARVKKVKPNEQGSSDD